MSNTPQFDLQLTEEPTLATGQPEPLTRTAVDNTAFWETEPLGMSRQNQPPSSVAAFPVTPKHQTNPLTVVMGLFLVVVAGWYGWRFSMYGETPQEALAGLFEDAPPEVIATEKPVEAPVPVAVEPKAPRSEVNNVSGTVPRPGLTSPAPYVNLKNILASTPTKMNGGLNSEQEVNYRAGLESPNYYPRYKAVVDIVGAREQGSEQMLRDALHSGKFWMRMQALMGLADFGYKTTPEDIQTALGDAHSELRARFFSRFEVPGRCSAGCFMIMRGAMPFLDAAGRLAALKVVVLEGSDAGSSYVVAGTFDEDAKVRAYAVQALLKAPVGESLWWETFDLIFGKAAVPAGAVGKLTSDQAPNSAATEQVAANLENPSSESQTAVKQLRKAPLTDANGNLIGAGGTAAGSDLSTQFINYITGAALGVIALIAIIALLSVVAYAKLFAMAGEPWWGVFVPIYNLYLTCKIAGVSGWVVLGLFVPIVNGLTSLYMLYKFAKAFREEDAYCAMFALFNPIMAPIMAFSSSTQHLDSARRKAVNSVGRPVTSDASMVSMAPSRISA